MQHEGWIIIYKVGPLRMVKGIYPDTKEGCDAMQVDADRMDDAFISFRKIKWSDKLK